ncbi:putative protein [Clostridium bornimense]|uniref:Uncharacterized protein n=1 Tax=Clostridium bornimense TaxID=1216932 RepID=W6RUR0_9CLOT|nr:hypothetical protein [Clostridium bornimense]CDM67354.1 putative protein [Clostridium bornimense]
MALIIVFSVLSFIGAMISTFYYHKEEIKEIKLIECGINPLRWIVFILSILGIIRFIYYVIDINAIYEGLIYIMIITLILLNVINEDIITGLGVATISLHDGCIYKVKWRDLEEWSIQNNKLYIKTSNSSNIKIKFPRRKKKNMIKILRYDLRLCDKEK